MPDYTLTAPNGQTYRITAPDPAAAANALRELTGTAAPAGALPGAGPVDLTRAGNRPLNDEQWYQATYGRPAPLNSPNDDYMTQTQLSRLRQQQDPQGATAWQQELQRQMQGTTAGQQRLEQAPDVVPVGVAPGNPAERAFELGLQSVGAGVADVAGMPVDLSNAFLNLLYSGVNRLAGREVIPLQATPFGGSQSIRDTATTVAEPLGLETLDREQMTWDERLGYDAIRAGTGAVVGAGGILGTARALAPAVGAIPAPMAGPLAQTGRALAAPYAATPGRAFVGDAAAGVGAGTANFAYEQMAPEALQESAYGPLANMLASIFGGVTGATTLNLAESAVRGTANRAADAVRGPMETNPRLAGADGSPFRRQDLIDAGTIVQARTNGWGQSGNARSLQAAAEIEAMQNRLGQYAGPNSLPTSGLASNNPGVIGTEQRLRTKMPEIFVDRDNAVRQAAVDTAQRIAPQGATGRQFTDEVEFLDADRVAAAKFDVDTVQQQVRDAELAGMRDANPVSIEYPLRRQEEAARGIDRFVVDETLRPMQDESAQMFAEARRLGATEIVNVEPVRGAVDEVTRSISQLIDPATNLPTDLAARITAAIDETGQITVADIVDLWPSLSRLEDAANRAGNVPLARNIRTIRDGFGAALDDAAQVGNLPGAQASIAARQNFADTLGDTFGRNAPVSQQLRRDFNMNQDGRSYTPRTETAGRFMGAGPARPERMAELDNIAARTKNPERARELINEHLMTDLAASGVLDRSGMLRADRLRQWRDRWGSALDRSPDTVAMVDDLIARADNGEILRGNLAGALREATERLTQVERDKGAFAFVLDNNPENAVGAIFAGGDPERAVQEILARIGTDDSALNGFKASVREYMTERLVTANPGATTQGDNPLAFGALDKLFRRHEDTLALIFDADEMNALQASREFLRPLNNLRQQANPGSATAERAQQFWNYLEVGLKARYGILKGGGLLRTIRLWAKTMPDNATAVGQIQRDMMFNPELAKHLLQMPIRDVGTPRYNSTLNRLLGYAEGSREDQERRQKLAGHVEN